MRLKLFSLLKRGVLKAVKARYLNRCSGWLIGLESIRRWVRFQNGNYGV